MTVYINGIRATKGDLALLLERVSKGLERILEVRTTKGKNIAVITA